MNVAFSFICMCGAGALRLAASARGLAEAALKSDPKVALAHEGMGFVEFNEGKDEDALREFSQAADLDPKSYISVFAKTMISPMARSAAQRTRSCTRRRC